MWAKNKLEHILAENPNVTRKLRALWCLHCIGAINADRLISLLRHKEEHIRVWAIQLLVDHGAPKSEIIDLFTKIAKTEKSGLVRLYLASALRKLPREKRWPLANALAQCDDLQDDPVFPLMLWYGIESAVAENTTATLKLVSSSKIPKLRQFATRRLAEKTQ